MPPDAWKQRQAVQVSPELAQRGARVGVDAVLTVDEVAELLKVTRSWVYEHTRTRGTPKSERLPHIKLGKYVRFEPAALRAFVERKRGLNDWR
ncbi:MAG TPA: helix-turn-helix domain-containing protein [Gemmatimonadaceae bacterium]|nr:helix-turn-helix domain-containing protein [Gemmatimonadaceae bacterium]